MKARQTYTSAIGESQSSGSPRNTHLPSSNVDALSTLLGRSLESQDLPSFRSHATVVSQLPSALLVGVPPSAARVAGGSASGAGPRSGGARSSRHALKSEAFLDTYGTSDDFDVSAETGNELDVGPRGQTCGSWLTVCCQHCGPSSERRIYQSCGDRLLCKWCRQDWVRDTQRRYAPVLHAMREGRYGRCRFVTLTVANGFDLAERLKHLRTSWRLLSQRKFWKRNVVRGVRVLEVTFNPETGWHVHFHLIVEGNFLEFKILQAAWREVTGDSFVVNVKATHGDVSKELFKYTLKDAGLPADRLQEAKAALKGCRLVELIGADKAMRRELRGLRLKREKIRCECCGGDAWISEATVLQFWWCRDGPAAVPRSGIAIPVDR